MTGAYVALQQAFTHLVREKLIDSNPLYDQVAAISCGVVNGEVLTDLDYEEDSNADVDANFVIAASGGLIEVQATGESGPFTKTQFNEMLSVAEKSCQKLFEIQKAILETL